jgi:hypothetical protein
MAETKPFFRKHVTLEETQGYFERSYTKIQSYKSVVRQTNKITARFPNRPADSIFRFEVDEWCEELKAKYAPRTIINLRKVGSVWYRWMQEAEAVPWDLNPFLARGQNWGPKKEKPSN